MGQVEDVRKCVTMDLKEAGNTLYIVGNSEASNSAVYALDVEHHRAEVGEAVHHRRVIERSAADYRRGATHQIDGAGVRGDLPEGARGQLFAGHSLRAGLASSAEVDERYVQKQLGHASAEMTRKYQRRRDRFRVNLTKASGL